MLIASFGGEELFNKTRLRYLEENKDIFLQSTFKNIVTRNLSKLIDVKTLHEWKEILAYCVTYSEDNGEILAMELGTELLKRNDADSALLCFIIAKNYEGALEIWNKKLVQQISKLRKREIPILFHKVFEKMIVLKTIIKNYDTSELFDQFILYFLA